jgi:hypothetical protein
MKHLLAQSVQIPGMNGALQGPLDNRFGSFADVVSKSLDYLFPVAGMILLVYLIWGGFDYLLSMGDPKKAEMGRKKITNALLGFFLIFGAYWITQIVDYVFKLGVYNP